MPVDTVQYFHGESTMSLSHLIQKHKKDLEEQKSVDWSARLERWKSELSVYLHFVTGGVTCCADLPTHPIALHCASVVARRHCGPLYDCYPAQAR